MVRPRKLRYISGAPQAFVYKPAGVSARQLDWVELSTDEFETIRLIDHLGLDQSQAAERMHVSRPTVTRMYAAARKKIADALTMAMAIRIETAQPVPLEMRGRRRHHGLGRGRLKRNNQQENKQGDVSMKIAIGCLNNETSSQVSQRLGRCPWIGLYDTNGGKWEFIENSQNQNAAQGAGIQTAQNIVNAGATVLLTPNTGPKAMHVLGAAGVEIYQTPAGKNVEQCVELYSSGALKKIESANVEGHWV